MIILLFDGYHLVNCMLRRIYRLFVRDKIETSNIMVSTLCMLYAVTV